MTIQKVLKQNIQRLKEAKVEDASLKARLLLSSILHVPKEYFVIHSEEEIMEELVREYETAIEKICYGYPLQYITHMQEFMKLDFHVDEHVLIPQPDTEILVEEAISLIQKDEPKTHHILDLCTGSGAIAVSIAKYCKSVNVVATDISQEALEIAGKNAQKHQTEDRICFVQSDMFEEIKEEKFDMIVSNPPYIKPDVLKTLSKEVQKEPKIALDGGEDGLAFYRIIAKRAKEFLTEAGYLLLEIGYDQRHVVENLLEKQGYIDIHCKKDLAGNDRVILCRKETF